MTNRNREVAAPAEPIVGPVPEVRRRVVGACADMAGAVENARNLTYKAA